MAADAEIKLRNLESSILYLQQEHSNTLKGLHQEIHNLQKKNSELTFQLAMVATSTTEEDELRTKVVSLESRLKDLQVSNDDNVQVIAKKDKKISALEKQQRAQERKFADELKGWSSKFKLAQNEIEAKSGSIAQLTHQLHAARKELRRDAQRQEVVFQPAPPPKEAPRPARRIRKNMITVDFSERPNSGSSSGSSRDLCDPAIHPPPDPTPFLPHKSQHCRDLSVQMKKKQDPLPPILPHDMDQSKSKLNRHALGRVRLTERRGKGHVVKLAVDHVPGTDAWRQTESGSADYK